MQDKCIANFMGEPKILGPSIFLLSLVGILFIFPFIIYLLLNYNKQSNIH